MKLPQLSFLASSATLVLAEGIYNSSTTPSDLPWNTYNYCNAPHVNAEHYDVPSNAPGAKLVYLNVVMRHHKVRFTSVFRSPFTLFQLQLSQRTPDNLFPSESAFNPASAWDCGFFQIFHAEGTRPVNRHTTIPSWHPFAGTIWNGTCDAGQMTQQGLDDSIRHGKACWCLPQSKFMVVTNDICTGFLVRVPWQVEVSEDGQRERHHGTDVDRAQDRTCRRRPSSRHESEPPVLCIPCVQPAK
jgi:hypothetical protein